MAAEYSIAVQALRFNPQGGQKDFNAHSNYTYEANQVTQERLKI